MGSEQARDQPIGGQDLALTGQHFHSSQTFSVLLPSFFKMEEKLFQQIQKIDWTWNNNKRLFFSRSIIVQYQTHKCEHLKGKQAHQRPLKLQAFRILEIISQMSESLPKFEMIYSTRIYSGKYYLKIFKNPLQSLRFLRKSRKNPKVDFLAVSELTLLIFWQFPCQSKNVTETGKVLEKVWKTF